MKILIAASKWEQKCLTKWVKLSAKSILKKERSNIVYITRSNNTA